MMETPQCLNNGPPKAVWTLLLLHLYAFLESTRLVWSIRLILRWFLLIFLQCLLQLFFLLWHADLSFVSSRHSRFSWFLDLLVLAVLLAGDIRSHTSGACLAVLRVFVLCLVHVMDSFLVLLLLYSYALFCSTWVCCLVVCCFGLICFLFCGPYSLGSPAVACRLVFCCGVDLRFCFQFLSFL